MCQSSSLCPSFTCLISGYVLQSLIPHHHKVAVSGTNNTDFTAAVYWYEIHTLTEKSGLQPTCLLCLLEARSPLWEELGSTPGQWETQRPGQGGCKRGHVDYCGGERVLSARWGCCPQEMKLNWSEFRISLLRKIFDFICYQWMRCCTTMPTRLQ